MDKEQVLALMRSSKTEDEWDANCDKVKAACGGYPPRWFAEVLASGLMKEVMGAGADKISISRPA